MRDPKAQVFKSIFARSSGQGQHNAKGYCLNTVRKYVNAYKYLQQVHLQGIPKSCFYLYYFFKFLFIYCMCNDFCDISLDPLRYSLRGYDTSKYISGDIQVEKCQKYIKIQLINAKKHQEPDKNTYLIYLFLSTRSSKVDSETNKL